MSEVNCNLCGKRLELEMGGVVCDGCFRPREDWLKDIAVRELENKELVKAKDFQHRGWLETLQREREWMALNRELVAALENLIDWGTSTVGSCMACNALEEEERDPTRCQFCIARAALAKAKKDTEDEEAE